MLGLLRESRASQFPATHLVVSMFEEVRILVFLGPIAETLKSASRRSADHQASHLLRIRWGPMPLKARRCIP